MSDTHRVRQHSAKVSGAAGDETPVIPTTPDNESAQGWGADENDGLRDAAWYERERPPHHE